jgi:hypothetical protein
MTLVDASPSAKQFTREQVCSILNISRQALLSLEATQVAVVTVPRQYHNTRPVLYDEAELRWLHVVVGLRKLAIPNRTMVRLTKAVRLRVRELPLDYQGLVMFDGVNADVIPQSVVGTVLQDSPVSSRLLAPIKPVT